MNSRAAPHLSCCAHPLPCCAHPLSRCAPPLSCCASPVTLRAPPLSCCAQSQHPEMPVERSEPGVPGFRDYARNDEVEEQPKPEVPGLCDYARNDPVEDTAPCGTHPPVMRRAKDAQPRGANASISAAGAAPPPGARSAAFPGSGCRAACRDSAADRPARPPR